MKPTCPVCELSHTEELLRWGTKHSIYVCHNYNLRFSYPLPDDKELFEAYQGFLYKKPEVKRIKKEIDSKKKEIVSLFNLSASDNLKNKTFLDCGAGTGIASAAAKALGLDVYLQEIDEKSIEFIQDELGIETARIVRTLEKLSGKHFDFIFCDNVIEHDTSPIDFVKKLYGLLNSNGILIIKTPNAGNTDSFLYPYIIVSCFYRALTLGNSLKNTMHANRQKWWHCEPPIHIYGFSERNLVIIVQRLSIKDAEISYYQLPFKNIHKEISFV